MRSNDLLRQAIPPDLRHLRGAPVTRCPTCGAPCNPPLSARLADLGHDPLVHCEILAIYDGKPCVPCVGQAVYRQCQLCRIGQALGTWTQKRGSWVFEPNGMHEQEERIER